MPEKKYDKEMIDQLHSELRTEIQHIKKVNDQIYSNVKEQNGRVKKNEMKLSFLFGGLAIISAVVLPLAFIVIQSFI